MPTADTLSSPSASVASLVPGYGAKQVLLSIVFHPDNARLGEFTALGSPDGPASIELGRSTPAFTRCGPDATGSPLAEDHVSRRALVIGLDEEGAEIRRLPGSSRARVAGVELGEEPVRVGGEAIQRGVTVSLAHGVVLLLHLGDVGAAAEDHAVAGLLGGSSAMRELRRQLLRIAASGADVLVRGETGTGKELVARALHAASPRAAEPWVAVNMAAIPAALAPALLFGARKGAFTGADSATEGYFQAAEGGSLFLDEVGDTPFEVQPQLLRALQQREIQPVGGKVQGVDLRIISATDANVEEGGGQFRSALLHRLGAAELYLPPLRERREDIGTLLWHFLRVEFAELGREHLLPGLKASAASTALWSQLFHCFLQYDWPGNVRELANAARAVALATEGLPVLPPALYRKLQPGVSARTESAGEPSKSPRPLSELTDEEIATALADAKHEIAAAARRLGVSRTGLYRRIDKSDSLRLPVAIPLEEIRDAVAASGGDEETAAGLLGISVAGLRGRLGREPGLRRQ